MCYVWSGLVYKLLEQVMRRPSFLLETRSKGDLHFNVKTWPQLETWEQVGILLHGCEGAPFFNQGHQYIYGRVKNLKQYIRYQLKYIEIQVVNIYTHIYNITPINYYWHDLVDIYFHCFSLVSQHWPHVHSLHHTDPKTCTNPKNKSVQRFHH